MKIRILTAIAMTTSLASCATQAKDPKTALLNRYAFAETVAHNCPAYGGYAAVTQMRDDAHKNLASARALGATDKDIAKARNNANGTYVAAAELINPYQACNAMISDVAWAGTSKPVIQPQKTASAKRP